MKKRLGFCILLLAISLLLTGCQVFDPPTGWVETDGVRQYYFSDGTLATGRVEIEGACYYFDPEGSMQTGWLVLEEGRFFFSDTGAMETGWLTLEEGTYYVDPQGGAACGWLTLEDNRYYFSDAGLLQTGWLELAGKRYYLGKDGTPTCGWTTVDGKHRYFDAQGALCSGWVTLEDGTYYLTDDGEIHTGWLTLEGKTYYLSQQGILTTGFAMVDNRSYYFDDNGCMATGKRVIGGKTCYFEENGAQILLVNPWNPLPEHYVTQLGLTENGLEISELCRADLARMLAACRSAGHGVKIKSANRTMGAQIFLHNKKVQEYLALGYSQAQAKAIAATIVAVPGTSEHQLGLAVDLADSSYLTLDRTQETMPAQKWLMANSWRYGFILRYPNSKSQTTGIIYEPWHYRYVGKELAKKIYKSGLCLEEYLETTF